MQQGRELADAASKTGDSLGRTVMRKNGFTVLELMVCIAILVILAAISYPVFQSAIQAGKEAKVRSNLAQMHRAALIYAVDYQDHSAPGSLSGLPTSYQLSVSGLIVPYEMFDPICRPPTTGDPSTAIRWWVTWTPEERARKVLADYELFGESMILVSNHSCNPPDITEWSTFRTRRAFGVELNGRVRVHRAFGKWDSQQWWQ